MSLRASVASPTHLSFPRRLAEFFLPWFNLSKVKVLGEISRGKKGAHFLPMNYLRQKSFLISFIQIQPKGLVTVKLPNWGETYTWTNVNCTIHNIIVGKLWMEQYGTMEIVNHQTGHKAVLQFKPGGSIHKDLHRVEGTIQDKE